MKKDFELWEKELSDSDINASQSVEIDEKLFLSSLNEMKESMKGIKTVFHYKGKRVRGTRKFCALLKREINGGRFAERASYAPIKVALAAKRMTNSPTSQFRLLEINLDHQFNLSAYGKDIAGNYHLLIGQSE